MYNYELISAMIAGFAGLFVFAAIISIAVYVLYGLSHMKALKMMGYQNAWGAWIPFYSSYVLADCIPESQGDVNIFGLSIPGKIFKFWWVLTFVTPFIPVVGTILTCAIRILCAGKCYASIYATLEGKTENEVNVVGYVSGLINLVAIVKFFTYK